MVPVQFVVVCAKFANAAVAVSAPLAAILPLQHAIKVLQPSPAHFTPIHAEFMRMALLARCYSAAKPILEQDLLQVDKEHTGCSPRDLLLYHYYAGMVLCGLKKFKLSAQYFTLCYSAPTHVVHAVMVESYKKCVLASLLDSGKLPVQPKYTALPIQRFLKTGVAPYMEFANAFGSRKLETLRASLQKHEAAFERDHNLGLAKQCIQALIRRNILRLTQAYLTLSLSDIATLTELASPAEAAACIISMVASGSISATIDEALGMVHFSEDPDGFDSCEAVATMEQGIGDAINAAEKLGAMHAQLSLDASYLSRMMRERSQARWEDDGMTK
mmetsp:Transcript_4763/g.14377  ORF Transcript_4763/g.14377 Transcript_4763/m.14377 type:complete len:330 (+) Transcript_4763:453-1442(+)